MGADTKAGDLFGGAISMSGDTVVSVAANEDGAGDDSGAAYVFTRSGAAWRQQGLKLVGNDTSAKHHFGRSVSISSDSVVVGSRTYEGSAYVFVRSETTWGPLWSEQAKLEAGDKRGGDEFGRSVGIFGDLIVVGAPNGNPELGNFAGAAYIFRRAGTTWTQEGSKIWGTDTKAGHYFGDTVDISGGPSGITVVVGTSIASAGAVYVFTRSAALVWTQQAKIYRSGPVGGDNFGASLSIYHDTLVVGAPADDDGLNDAGAAYIFTRFGTAWNQTAKFVAIDKAEDHRFGTSVSVSESTLAVVAQGVRDASGNYGGSVYAFSKSETLPLWSDDLWSQQIKVGGVDTVFGDKFGASVSVSGNYIASGAPRVSAGGSSAGAAYFLKCMTTTTTTPLPVEELTTRKFSTDQLGSLSQKQGLVTGGVGSTPWGSIWLALLSVLAAFPCT